MKLSKATKQQILERDILCVVCDDTDAEVEVFQIRPGDSSLNGCGICSECKAAITRREVGIAGFPPIFSITDGRKEQDMAKRAAGLTRKKKTHYPEDPKDLPPATPEPEPSGDGAENPPASPADVRVTTFKPNGGSSHVVAPEPSAVDLGPILVPTPERAVVVLRDLALLNDRAIQAKQRYEDAKDKAKALKAKWDGLAEEVQTYIRQSTHGSDLPLFAEQAEADLSAMVAGGEVVAADDLGTDIGASGNVGEALPPPIDVAPDEIPFVWLIPIVMPFVGLLGAGLLLA